MTERVAVRVVAAEGAEEVAAAVTVAIVEANAADAVVVVLTDTAPLAKRAISPDDNDIP